MQLNVQGNNGIILVDDLHKEKLQGAKIYRVKRKNGQIGYAVKTPEMKSNQKVGLSKFLFNRNFQQIKRGNDFRAENLKNLSSKYFCVYKDASNGDFRFTFKHNGKKYDQGGFRNETQAALSHDRLVKTLNLDRECLLEINREKQVSKQKPQQSNTNHYDQLRLCVLNAIKNLGSQYENINSNQLFLLADQSMRLSHLLYLIEDKKYSEIETVIHSIANHDVVKYYLDYIKEGV